MKSILIIYFTLLSFSAHAQKIPKLPNDSLLIASLSSYFNSKLTSQLKPLDVTRKRSWTLLLPSLGLAYNLQGQPRPSISINPLNFLNYLHKKKQIKALATSEILNNNLEKKSSINELKRKINTYNLKCEIYNLNQDIQQIDIKLFEITQEKYNQNLIKPSEYLQHKKNQIQLKKSNLVELNQILYMYNEILNFAHFSN